MKSSGWTGRAVVRTLLMIVALFAVAGCANEERETDPDFTGVDPVADDSGTTVAIVGRDPVAGEDGVDPPAMLEDVEIDREPAREPEDSDAAVTPARTPDPSVDWPGLTIDFENKWIDLEGAVSIDAGWLEQVVCLPGTRTHESIFVVFARPSHIHAALLALGAEPGRPGRWVPVEEDEGVSYVVEPPEGDPVAVRVRYTRDGEVIDDPVSKWIRDHHTGRTFPERPWIFGGSKMVENFNGEVVYAADVTGSVVGLVTFGGELLGWHEVLPDKVAFLPPEWEVNTEVVPEPDTAVTIRLIPDLEE
ncbi:MAG: YdjY domain-containing protein [Phycisphaerales bacterium]